MTDLTKYFYASQIKWIEDESPLKIAVKSRQVNELNRLLDLGIKPLPWGDTPYVPAALQPVLAPQSPTLQVGE